MNRTDRALDIRTARCELLERMRVCGDNLRHATRYEPTPTQVIADMMISLDIDATRFTFVDLGAGKGRALCLASEFGFAEIIGVEFADQLCSKARENVERFKAPWRRSRSMQVVHLDAADYSLPNEPLVLYLFNPFGPPVLGRIVEKIEAHPGPLYVLYYMPEHAIVLDRSPSLERIETANHWVIYALLRGPK